jgi:hypothetical protein
MTVYVLVLNEWDPCRTLKAAAVLGVFSTREAAERARGGSPDGAVTEHVLDQVGEVEFGLVWSINHNDDALPSRRESWTGRSFRRRGGWDCSITPLGGPLPARHEFGPVGPPGPTTERASITVTSAVSHEHAERVLDAILRLSRARRALRVATRRGVSAEGVRMLGREVEEAEGGLERLRTPNR